MENKLEEFNIKIEFILNQMIVIQAQNKKLNTKLDKCLEILSSSSSDKKKQIKLSLPPLEKLRKLPSNSESVKEFCQDAAAV